LLEDNYYPRPELASLVEKALGLTLKNINGWQGQTLAYIASLPMKYFITLTLF
jgi:hypothetical protein